MLKGHAYTRFNQKLKIRGVRWVPYEINVVKCSVLWLGFQHSSCRIKLIVISNSFEMIGTAENETIVEYEDVEIVPRTRANARAPRKAANATFVM